jgi:hypothetical protein
MTERDPLPELEEFLSFPVSPDFCARVRQQVAAEPVRMRMFGVRNLALAAAVLVAAATGFIATSRDASVGVAQVSPRPGVTTRAPAPAEREPVVSSEPVRVRQQPVPVAARETVTPFETVVPDDQLHALDRLLAAMRAGTATVPPVVADAEVNDRGERVLKALVIEPVTVELLAGTPAEPIKNPVKNPNK